MSNFRPTCKYICVTLRHKYFVFLAGLRTKAPVTNLILHDWTKLTPFEAPHYARQLHGDKSRPIDFSHAWNHHHKSNKHHWEYWVLVQGHSSVGLRAGEALPIPEKYVREMVADWLAADRIQNGKWIESMDDWPWFARNFKRINFHPETRKLVLKVCREAFSKSHQESFLSERASN